MKPPVAKPIPKKRKAFGDTRQDPYFYMRYREDPAVIDYAGEIPEIVHLLEHERFTGALLGTREVDGKVEGKSEG